MDHTDMDMINIDYVAWLQARELYQSVVRMCDEQTPYIAKLRGTPYQLSDFLRFDLAGFIINLCGHDERKRREGIALYRILTGYERDYMGSFLQLLEKHPDIIIDLDTHPPRVLGLLQEAERDKFTSLSQSLQDTIKHTTALFTTVKQHLAP